MSKRNSSPAPAPAAAPTAPVRAQSVTDARDRNFGKVANPDNLVSAGVVLTAKGVNPAKARVYGYDTDNGKVPLNAVIAVVPGVTGTPKGVTPGQWLLLQGLAGKSVQSAYDGGAASRSVRRAYRAGFIRFINA